jgi:glycosyltransferase involved in cell wall biosynthesis
MDCGKISVILPAFNEGALIVDRVREIARELGKRDHEIIVVDDGSTDGTYACAQQAAAQVPEARVIHYAPNRGKGYALRQGFLNSRGELVAFLDADKELSPQQLVTFEQVMIESGADAVIGSKMHPRSRSNYPLSRRAVSYAYFTLVHALFGLPIHDTQTGIKLFRRAVLEQLLPRMQVDRFAFDLELLVAVHMYRYSMVEVPVIVAFSDDSMGVKDLIHASLNVASDTVRVFYQTSFWNWLRPGIVIKLWATLLVFGLVAGGVGIGHLLNNFGSTAPFDQIMNVVLLRFLDRALRDWILFLGGLVVVATAAIQLNKHIVSAFARQERTESKRSPK